MKVSDQVFMDGGVNPERLKAVATGEQLKADLTGYETASDKKVHSTGGTTFEGSTLQQFKDSSTDGRAVIVIYLCEDVSKVDVLNSAGVSIVSSDRPNRVAYEIGFDSVPALSGQLFVSHKETWAGGKC
ncbi:hypothetical protein [Glaciihabitans sp. UYNi722]|uniref:hypothetical protein n=1 Tax=Glaciihabitans sp. UYNi722 TaxID=3156344 RepID=UPI0033922AEF